VKINTEFPPYLLANQVLTFDPTFCKKRRVICKNRHAQTLSSRRSMIKGATRLS